MPVTRSKKSTRTTSRRAPKATTPKATTPKAAAPRFVGPGLATRSSNRRSNRPAGAGQPPAGPINAQSVESEVLYWIGIPKKRKADYCPYRTRPLLDDGFEMREGRADLPLFSRHKTPITARDFDRLDLLLDAMVLLGDEPVVEGGERELISEDMQQAIYGCQDARSALARRAEACGIPLRLFKLDRAYSSPAPMVAACQRIARVARAQLPLFYDQAHALRLIEALEKKTETLAALVARRDRVSAGSAVVQARRAALKRLLLDTLMYIGPWGRDVTAGDPTKRNRYALDKLFPSEAPRQAGAAATDEPAPDDGIG